VLNLLSNALKSTFDGEIRVAIRSTATEVELRVTDTGTGISESDLPQLFQRFRRIDGARRRSHEGSGIGWHWCRSWWRCHGGSIGVESKLGEGTTFTVRMPFGQHHLTHGRVVTEGRHRLGCRAPPCLRAGGDGLAAGPRSAQEEVTRAVTGDRTELAPSTYPAEDKQKILLVDDTPICASTWSAFSAGVFEVVEAENGKVALEQAASRVPDLVLTDVMMPELDGFGLLKGCARIPPPRTVPVIMLSARGGEEARIEGVDAGADDYLTKPSPRASWWPA